MKILFIWPWTRLNQSSSFFNKIYFKAFSVDDSPFPSLISVTPKEHEIEVIKVEKPSEIDYTKEYDVVGISCIVQDVYTSYEIADNFRKQKIPVVLGGWHASALPEEAKQHADSVVIGEAEDIWPQLLNDLENHKLKSFYYQDAPVNISNTPVLPKIVKNKNKLNILATRGCPNKCDFCAISTMNYRKIYRMRPIQTVIDEIKRYTGKRFIFVDASLTISTNYTKELFMALKEMKKKFIAFGNINILERDDELLKLASEAGCIRWFVGFESICQESLDSVYKRNLVKDYLFAIKKIHDYGITVEGGFILGFDHDTTDVFDKTYKFLIKSEIEIATLRILTPYPGTPLYSRLDKENRILTKNWAEYTTDKVVFKPKNMTPEQLQLGFENLYDKWHNNLNSNLRIMKSIKYGFHPFIASFQNNFFFSNLIRYGLFQGERIER